MAQRISRHWILIVLSLVIAGLLAWFIASLSQPTAAQDGSGEGCTHGFWKQEQHFDSWTDPYDPEDKFSDVFGVVITVGAGGQKTITDPILLEALQATGGGVSALARHAVAALLNAASPDVDYAFTVDQVIDMVQTALEDPDDPETGIEAAKNKLEAENERGCPLSYSDRDSSDRDSTEDPVVDAALAGGGTEIPEDDEDALLEGVAMQVPPSEQFEFLGEVRLLTEAEYEELDRARRERLLGVRLNDFIRGSATEDTDRTSDDRMILVSADGRMYRERLGVFPDLPPDITTSSIDRPPPVGSIESAPLYLLSSFREDAPALSLGTVVGLESVARKIWGSEDGRQLVTSAEWPWRAVGVSLRDPNNLGISRCSASMIAPRVALTSAHCVSPDGNSLRERRVAPAARGPSFPGEQFPFGTRFVEWYVWPSRWEGQDTARYDYAMLILRDIDWSPGWVFVGTKSDIAYTRHNTAGYPGNAFDCADAPVFSNGKCGGYMYRQYEKIRSAGYGYFFHQFDTNPGQSGSPIYEFKRPTFRKVFGVNEGSLGQYNTATRINKQSFGLICKVLNGDFKYEINGELRTSKSSFFPNPKCN